MSPKEYLMQIRRLNEMIRQRMDQKEELEQLYGISGNANGEHVQTSPRLEAPFIRVIERIETLIYEVNNLIDEYVNTKNLIISQIQSLSNHQYSVLLYKRYVDCKRLETVAVEMNYSYYRIKHLHGYALREFGKLYKDILKVDTR